MMRALRALVAWSHVCVWGIPLLQPVTTVLHSHSCYGIRPQNEMPSAYIVCRRSMSWKRKLNFTYFNNDENSWLQTLEGKTVERWKSTRFIMSDNIRLCAYMVDYTCVRMNVNNGCTSFRDVSCYLLSCHFHFTPPLQLSHAFAASSFVSVPLQLANIYGGEGLGKDKRQITNSHENRPLRICGKGRMPHNASVRHVD